MSAAESSPSEPSVPDRNLSDAPFRRTRAALERGIDEGLHVGGQVYASIGVGREDSGRSIDRYGLTVGQRRLAKEGGEGEPVTPDTIWIWLSSTKPVTAIALALLWERGELDLDDPVARFVPEFAAEGKGAITLRHLLTHTGGIRMLNLGWPEASWDEIVAKIAARRPEPRWTPGEKAGYHLASSWFILGEVIARLAGRPFPAFVREALLEPVGMATSWIGMPTDVYGELEPRIARMYGTETGPTGDGRIERGWHREAHVVGSSPGGNGHGPLRELGLFYEMLLRRGVASSGERILTPQTVEAMTTPHRVGLQDLTFKAPLVWGLGFIIDSKLAMPGSPGTADDGDAIPYGYGLHASRRAFGHSGFQSSTAFADPEHDLVVVAAVNGQPGEERHARRFHELTTAIYEDLELAKESA